MRRALVIALEVSLRCVAGLALGCAAVVAAPFAVIAIGSLIVASDLSDEWRRGRRQTRLWRWAQRMRGAMH